jgi:hypothetical protein
MILKRALINLLSGTGERHAEHITVTAFSCDQAQGLTAHIAAA